MEIQERIKELIVQRDKANKEWLDGVKYFMKDGKERPVLDEESDDEETKGMLVRVGDSDFKVDACVDKVCYNDSHRAFKFHLISLDYIECDRYVMEWELTKEEVTKLLEHIVWE